MGRTIEISGNWIMYLWYASVLGIIPIIVHFWVLPLDDWRSTLGLAISTVLLLIVVGHVWHLKRVEGIEQGIRTADLPWGLTYSPGSLQYGSKATTKDDDDD